jgi:hypothetical protein
MSKQSRKYQRRIEPWLIKALSWVLDSWMFFKPFSTAVTLDQYYNRGYWYGFCFLIFIGILFLALEYSGLYLGFLTTPGTELPEEIKKSLKSLPEILGLQLTIPSYFRSFPIYFLIPLIYLAFNLIPPLKKKVGELFSKLFILIFSKSIDAGEWFIQRRWISLISILVLSMLITVGLYYLFFQALNKSHLREDLIGWFVRTENFIESDSLTELRNNLYEESVEKHWDPSFETFFTSSDKKTTSFSILNEILKQLHGNKELREGWFAHLKTIDVKKVSNNKPSQKDTIEELRVWCLIYILSGRIHNRRFEKEFNDLLSHSTVIIPPTEPVAFVNSNTNINANSNVNLNVNVNLNSKANINTNSNANLNLPTPNLNANQLSEILENLELADKYFKSAKETLENVEKKLNSGGQSADPTGSQEKDDWIKKYRASINNGLGNSYSHHFKFLVKKDPRLNNAQDVSKRFNGCKYPRDCVSESKKYFLEASKDFEECSFQSIRTTNNIADLYMRIAQNYDIYAQSVSLDENKREMSRLELAAALDKQIKGLAECFNKRKKTSQIPPLILITLSQASAQSAKLKIKENIQAQNISSQVENSASYLKMAYSFNDPSSLLDWELEPFCPFFADTLTSKKMPQTDKDKYKDYQNTFKRILNTFLSDLESPVPQLERRIIEGKICQ